MQIGAILQNTETRQELAEFSLILSIHELIPPKATEIHGITDEMVAKFGINRSIVEILFTDFVLRADVLVAHNIEFDAGIIQDAWPHAYTAFAGKRLYDTMNELTPVMKLPKDGKNHYHDDKYPDWKAPRLQEAYNHYFGKDFEGAHNALDDTRACRDIYFAHQDEL